MSLAALDPLSQMRLGTTVPRGRKWGERKGAIGAGIAESDFGTAPVVKDALVRAVQDDLLTYLPDELANLASEACAQLYRTRFDWDVATDWIRATPDVLSALFAALRVFPQNTPVIVPTPCYSPFLDVPRNAGRTVVQLPMRSGSPFDLDRLEDALTTPGSVLILCNPHNPCGTVLSRATLVAISEIVERHGARVFVDEIHAPLVYEGHTHVPYASVSAAAAAHSITAISPSKGWNVPALKAAHAVVPHPEDRANWDALDHHPVRSGSTLGALGIAAAYGEEGLAWLTELVKRLDHNRRLLSTLLADRLPDVSYTQPDATYLAWLGFGAYRLPSNPADYLLENCAIATVSGRDCGQNNEQFIRFNFATSPDVIEQAVDRMARALRQTRL